MAEHIQTRTSVSSVGLHN